MAHRWWAGELVQTNEPLELEVFHGRAMGRGDITQGSSLCLLIISNTPELAAWPPDSICFPSGLSLPHFRSSAQEVRSIGGVGDARPLVWGLRSRSSRGSLGGKQGCTVTAFILYSAVLSKSFPVIWLLSLKPPLEILTEYLMRLGRKVLGMKQICFPRQ